MSFTEKVPHWHEEISDVEDNMSPEMPEIVPIEDYVDAADDIPDLEPDRDEERREDVDPDYQSQTAYVDFILESPAYRWLLAKFSQRISLLARDTKSMDAIKNSVLKLLPPALSMSRKDSAQAFRLTFEIELESITMRDVEEKGHLAESFATLISITGSLTNAQALPCIEYLRQTWPWSAESMLQLLRDVFCIERAQRVGSKIKSSLVILIKAKVICQLICTKKGWKHGSPDQNSFWKL